MNRTEFIIATAIILFVAFMLGWFAYWILHRLTRVSHADIGELDNMAQSLHEAELGTRLAQAEAELRATMEGLRDARAEAEELRAYIARQNKTA